MHHIIQTGQTYCYDSSGRKISCTGTGHDGDTQTGIPWQAGRFEVRHESVHDHLTDLAWTLDANIGKFPCTWPEALSKITALNREQYAGFTDWRLPNRNELRSLMSYQARKPALPDDHPFINVFLGWYWTSTTAVINPAYAWSVHMEGARMFFGRKNQYQLFWPVCGNGNAVLPATGQKKCYDISGNLIECAGTGQDGDLQVGSDWPRPRFSEDSGVFHDRLTGLGWSTNCDLTNGPANWQQALDAVQNANADGLGGGHQWWLPNINELASLIDCSSHNPALPQQYPFRGVKDGYWSSTTSFFETDWTWVLYLTKGACGVGHKPGKTFYTWPVTTLTHC